jgi:hypothetical protein
MYPATQVWAAWQTELAASTDTRDTTPAKAG